MKIFIQGTSADDDGEAVVDLSTFSACSSILVWLGKDDQVKAIGEEEGVMADMRCSDSVRGANDGQVNAIGSDDGTVVEMLCTSLTAASCGQSGFGFRPWKYALGSLKLVFQGGIAGVAL